MVENVLSELLCLLIGEILLDPACIKASLVHTDKTDGGEVVVERAEIALGVGIQTLVEELCDNVALDLERACGDVHHMVEAAVEVRFVLGEICDSRHIDGNDTDRAGGLTASEEATRLLAQLAQIETQTAAHRANVGGLHIAVDIVGEVGRSVLGGHLEEELVVLGLRPVKVTGDGVGGG